MARKKHSKKAVEAALKYAETYGWKVIKKGTGHAWGVIRCPHKSDDCRCGQFCQSSIWSTPKNPDNHARQIKSIVDGCINKEDKK